MISPPFPRFLLLLLLLWAAIYLPGLGKAELKGEEGRRALPAIAMLETGEWIVPSLNGVPYLRKPPLLNWLIAGAIGVTGERSELAARLPSVLAVLLLALVLWRTSRRWMPEAQAQIAAIFWLTSIAIIEKGRLAEIEALYVALVGAAFAFWLREWMGRRRQFPLWTGPALFLGVAMLAKGPTHLLFFYGMVIPVLWRAGEVRRLFSPAHVLGLLVIGAIFAAWAIPYFRATAAENAGGVWLGQIGNVVAGGSRELKEWLPNFASAAANALPWGLLAVLFWNRRVIEALAAEDPRRAELVIATRWPLAIGFIGLMIIPGVLPRYTLPLLPWALILFALVFPQVSPGAVRLWRQTNRLGALLILIAACAAPWIIRPAAFDLREWTAVVYVFLVIPGMIFGLPCILRGRSPGPGVQISATAALASAAIAFYAIVILPRKNAEDRLRPVAMQIEALSDDAEPLYVIGRAYELLFFYVEQPLKFEKSVRKIPDNPKQILFRRESLKRVQARWPQAPEPTRLDIADKKEFFLLKLSPETEKNPSPKPRP